MAVDIVSSMETMLSSWQLLLFMCLLVWTLLVVVIYVYTLGMPATTYHTLNNESFGLHSVLNFPKL